MAATTRHPFVAIGYALLGAGLVVEAYRAWKGNGAPPALLGSGLGESEGEAARRSKGAITRVKNTNVANIDERVALIQKRIREDSAKPIIREKAAAVLGRKCGTKWCVPEKDYAAEIRALYHAVRDPSSPLALRYTRDHNRIDQFTAADTLMKLRIGDCDDGSIYLGSMLTAVGYPVKLRVIQAKGANTWSHIYLLVGVPPGNPNRWIPLDWSMPGKPPGWEAPGASQVAQLGRPAGIVERVRDYDVYG